MTDVLLPQLSDAFFLAIPPMADRLGVMAEDLLIVFGGESHFNPHTSVGGGQGLIGLTALSAPMAGIGAYTDGKAVLNQKLAVFAALSGEEQLPYVEHYYQSAKQMADGIPYRNAFDLYFATAAPGKYADYRKNGKMPDSEAIYTGDEWINNCLMDNLPALFRKHGTEVQADMKSMGYWPAMLKWSAIGKAEGTLKGYVSLGDFIRYTEAVLQGSNWRDGLKRLRAVMPPTPAEQQGTAYGPASYVPGLTLGKSKAGTDPYDAEGRMAPLGVIPVEKETSHMGPSAIDIFLAMLCAGGIGLSALAIWYRFKHK